MDIIKKTVYTFTFCKCVITLRLDNFTKLSTKLIKSKSSSENLLRMEFRGIIFFKISV